MLILLATAPTYETEVAPSSSGGSAIWVILLIVAIVGWFKSGSGGHSAHGTGRDGCRADARQVKAPPGEGDGSWMSAAERRSTEEHEKRHERVAKRLGADGDWWIHDGGGTFQRRNTDHLNAIQKAAISYAGNGGSYWSGSYHDKQDEANAKYYINKLPRSERAAAHQEARRLARKLS